MTELSNFEKYLKELDDLTEDPIHKRLINAYKENNPMESMEAELGRILAEVMNRED